MHTVVTRLSDHLSNDHIGQKCEYNICVLLTDPEIFAIAAVIF
jgi:hypothetical protein